MGREARTPVPFASATNLRYLAGFRFGKKHYLFYIPIHLQIAHTGMKQYILLHF